MNRNKYQYNNATLGNFTIESGSFAKQGDICYLECTNTAGTTIVAGAGVTIMLKNTETLLCDATQERAFTCIQVSPLLVRMS